MFKQYKLRNYKFILVMYVVILNVIGILLIGSAKPSVQSKQILGMIAGLTIMVMLSLIDYNFILKFSWLIYFFMVGVLLLVMFAGDDAGGAQRWFEIGGFRFQPSELAKILIILFFAYFFMKHEEKINTPKVLITSFILAGIPLALILKQPDLSTTIVTALIFAALLFVAGLSYKIVRSEERRVGKECHGSCRSRWSPYHSSRRRHTRSTPVTGVQTCALPICFF